MQPAQVDRVSSVRRKFGTTRGHWGRLFRGSGSYKDTCPSPLTPGPHVFQAGTHDLQTLKSGTDEDLACSKSHQVWEMSHRWMN
jgi:hypothetical protein